jgi:hypothetical protein
VVVRLRSQLGLDILVDSTDYRSIRNIDIGNGNIGALLLMALKDLCLTTRNRVESVLGCHCFEFVFVFVFVFVFELVLDFVIVLDALR